MASRLLRSTDPSAPSLVPATLGSLITVLKAVLVNGYGSTAPLGWSVAFEDAGNNICVFRPGGTDDSRPFLRVRDNVGSSYAEVLAYSSMTGHSLGYFLFSPESAINRSWYKTAGITTAVPWEVVGDNRGFYLFTGGHSSYPNARIIWVFSEYPRVRLDNPFNWVVNGASSWQGGYPYTTTESSNTLFLQRDPLTKITGPISINLRSNGMAAGDSYTTQYIRKTRILNNKMVYIPVRFIYEISAAGLYTEPTWYGVMPGAYEPLIGSGTGTTYTNAQCLPILEEYSSTVSFFTVGTFASIGSSAPMCKMSFLVGEGFRNVY